MSLRSLSLTQGLHELRSDARQARECALVVSGRFDRSAIMRRAVQVARSLRAGGKSWTWRMGVALRTVWGWAKRDRAAPVVAPAISASAEKGQPAALPVRDPYRFQPRPARVFLRGSRAHSHGW